MSSKLSILIIEDEENIAGFIASMLNAHDYKTIITKTAEEGLSMIASHCPSLIILDLGLPDMDGMEVLKNLRNGLRYL